MKFHKQYLNPIFWIAALYHYIRLKLKKKEPVQEAPNWHNYALDKDQWVKFSDNRPKEKLRKRVAFLARKLNKWEGLGYENTRQEIIQAYNKDGMIGINDFMKDRLAKIIADRNSKLNKLQTSSK